MDVFNIHKKVIADYSDYTQSFIKISDDRIRSKVADGIQNGLLWPEPLLQLNPSFEPGRTVEQLVSEKILHEECGQVFRIKTESDQLGKSLRLHRHQDQAVETYLRNEPYVLTTGTGSGKSLSYIIPAVDHVLKNGTGRGIQAIIVYPMNALANSQREELDKFLKLGFEGKELPVSYARYTGQEGTEERERILKNPPDILLTNYVMLELILTRIGEQKLVSAAGNLRFLVFDELHTYRGRQGADVAMLVRRCRDAFGSDQLHCVGTSATMESEGTTVDQAKVVADVATKIFGEIVPVENVIGESLRRTTVEFDFESEIGRQQLAHSVREDHPASMNFEGFASSPMASWLESTFGLRREKETDLLIRQNPTAIEGEGGAASKLASLANVSVEQATETIERFLDGGTRPDARNPETGFNVFAFRLHQFITRGDTAWASLESEELRKITLRGQQYVPGDRKKILLPLVFCRCCGQEYYRINMPRDFEDDVEVEPREDFRSAVSESLESGYLYTSTKNPWPKDEEDMIDLVPPEWIEEHQGSYRIKRKQPVPMSLQIGTDGLPSQSGITAAFIKGPFRFCLNPKCKVAYNARQRSDVAKLATIGIDGRSTATTILALSTILKLRLESGLPEKAKKLLSFTDNRQDASLQAGHFNDFVEMGLLRSALYRAMERIGGQDGLNYDDLVLSVEKMMNLPIHLYSRDDELRGPALDETRRALRSVLRYYLYRDLERDWRVTSPNLEQCGLLKISYRGIDDCVNDTAFWENPPSSKSKQKPHALLAKATPEQRKRIIQALLDHLRRSLAIKEDSLSPIEQDKISEQSRQRLCEPWAIEDSRDMTKAAIAWPRAKLAGDHGYNDIFLSPQSNFGLFLSRDGVLPTDGEKLTLEARGIIIQDLFRCIRIWGLVEEVRSPVKGSLTAGYQIPSSMFLWHAGDGSEAMHDDLRVTKASIEQTAGNEYFIELYKLFADLGAGLEAREHTAQVQADEREIREGRFREGDLPVMFCSPTMELGVDISQLNVVNMRNVPPTPANYAQRSGRAGRSGQAALVYTYCSGFSPHDQYYFRNPDRMVAGRVTSPRIDLLNRDLIKSHIHAIWLSEAGLDLGKTLSEHVLVVNEDNLKLPLKDEINEKLNSDTIRLQTLKKARRLIDDMVPDIKSASWWREDWLNDVVTRLPQVFEEACERWRSLYRAAVHQRIFHNKVIGDHSRDAKDRDKSKRLRGQAESQINLLTNPQNVMQGDFYTYRYFASEGFLPGYNFPRLPLSAFIPARRGRQGRDEYLSRPRFLAISEFGPRAVIYHEGATYRVNKVNLQFADESNDINESVMKICSQCGYCHRVVVGATQADTCDACKIQLHPQDQISSLIRLQNVTVKRAERITSDEEERRRVGYQIQNTYQFATVNGKLDFRRSEVHKGEATLATMKYGDATTIWRINRGWRHQKEENKVGFWLDVERGYWSTNKDAEENDRDDPQSKNIRRVVPFVEDVRNALTFELENSKSTEFMASLQAAFKQAIQKVYQLESNELAVEPLPNWEDRNLLLFYEASEGGAGVLRQIAEDPDAIAKVARVAIELCHFDIETGDDLASELKGIECEAACYDCLLDYGNQPDHRKIDRKLIIEFLRDIAASRTEISGSGKSRADHFSDLLKLCDSGLEKKWLQQVFDQQMMLPSEAQTLIEECSTRPDFLYNRPDGRFAIYIDGPHHDAEDQNTEDDEINSCLISKGYMSIRFHHGADWDEVFDEYSEIFGPRKSK